MKATGITRRIDDLGRIVIPKEIRKNLRIKKGESLELYIGQNENIILKKDSQIDKTKEILKLIVDSIYQITKQEILITNTDKIIITTPNLKQYKNKQINLDPKEKETTGQNIKIVENKEEKKNYLITKITPNGDHLGYIIVLSEEEINDQIKKIVQIATNFLERYIEE